MGNVGRFFCVALPFLCCVASLIALLIAGLAGVTDKNLYQFQLNTKNVSLSPDTLQAVKDQFGDKIGDALNQAGGKIGDEAGKIGDAIGNEAGKAGDAIKNEANKIVNRDLFSRLLGSELGTIHASDLGLADLYDVSIWGYCRTDAKGERTCTKPAYNWAEAAFKNTTESLKAVSAVTKVLNAETVVTVPKEIEDAMNAFSTVSRWTQIIFIAAYIGLAAEIIVGIFANCSRIASCITWVIASIATTLVVAAASLATAMSTIVVGTVKGSAKVYGVDGDINTRYLATVWIAVAFAVVAGFFWIFTICCCKPEKRPSHKKNRDSQAGEKLIPGSYQPIHDPEHNGFNSHRGSMGPQYGNTAYGGRTNMGAYEPYTPRH